jgi:cellulose biosynthesis protein BcsQ
MRAKARRLTVFNHKGGVGKTTLTVNIGAALANAGKRVLLVDSDPQCNLSSYLIEDPVVDSLLDNSDKPGGKTIWTGVKPIVEAEGGYQYIEPYETAIKRLSLLPGDIRLSEFEEFLNDFWGDCLERRVRGFKGMSALSALVDECAKKVNADFVFYDTGPNVGPLNRAILLDCDYFIVPAACDAFSIRALRTLGSWPCPVRLDTPMEGGSGPRSGRCSFAAREAEVPWLYTAAVPGVWAGHDS